MKGTAAYILAALVGIALGIGIYTFVYAKGASYLSSDPATCNNCHIMSEHYDAWTKSSHRSVAGCNDCHTPANFFAKYFTKASNGFWHSFAFTTGDFPDPLRIKPHNRAVTEAACRSCHQDIVAAIEALPASHANDGAKGIGSGERPSAVEQMQRGSGSDAIETSCVRCHQYVGHWVR